MHSPRSTGPSQLINEHLDKSPEQRAIHLEITPVVAGVYWSSRQPRYESLLHIFVTSSQPSRIWQLNSMAVVPKTSRQLSPNVDHSSINSARGSWRWRLQMRKLAAGWGPTELLTSGHFAVTQIMSPFYWELRASSYILWRSFLALHHQFLSIAVDLFHSTYLSMHTSSTTWPGEISHSFLSWYRDKVVLDNRCSSVQLLIQLLVTVHLTYLKETAISGVAAPLIM